MKIEEIFMVSDGRLESIMPYQKEDLISFKKNSKVIHLAFDGVFLKNGFWKITIKSYFFGLYKQLALEQLRMPL